jgi:catechol 2,3-dioxygenase-like lactoylglutathione lyase family enzyme
MNAPDIGGIHHLMLTVSDLKRSQKFYTEILGFQVYGGSEENGFIVMSNGQLVMGINLPPDPSQTPKNDLFSEHRLGLDHLSLAVDNHDALLNAQRLFDENGVPHGKIEDLRAIGFPVYVMAFRDPDNIQLELTAPIPQ